MSDDPDGPSVDRVREEMRDHEDEFGDDSDEGGLPDAPPTEDDDSSE